MNAILIDPSDQSISRVEYNGEITDLYSLIDCRMFTVVSVTEDHDLFLDDEGMYREDQSYFMVNGYPQPLAGKAVMLGHDGKGGTIEATESVLNVARNIVFGRPVNLDGSLEFLPY